MKSYDPLDRNRLHVDHVHAETTDDGDQVLVHVRLVYTPWEPGPAQDRLWELRNAVTLVSKVLEGLDA